MGICNMCPNQSSWGSCKCVDFIEYLSVCCVEYLPIMRKILYGLIFSAAAIQSLAAQSRLERCSEEYYHQTLDHFGLTREARIWTQRYFVCDEFWRQSIVAQRPIFFYAGKMYAGHGRFARCKSSSSLSLRVSDRK